MPPKQVKKRRSSTLDRKTDDVPLEKPASQSSQSRNVKKKPDSTSGGGPSKLRLSTPKPETPQRLHLNAPKPPEVTPSRLRLNGPAAEPRHKGLPACFNDWNTESVDECGLERGSFSSSGTMGRMQTYVPTQERPIRKAPSIPSSLLRDEPIPGYSPKEMLSKSSQSRDVRSMPPPPRPRAQDASNRVGAARGTRAASQQLQDTLVSTAQAVMGSIPHDGPQTPLRVSTTPDYFAGSPQMPVKEMDKLIDSDDESPTRAMPVNPFPKLLMYKERRDTVPFSQKTTTDGDTTTWDSTKSPEDDPVAIDEAAPVVPAGSGGAEGPNNKKKSAKSSTPAISLSDWHDYSYKIVIQACWEKVSAEMKHLIATDEMKVSPGGFHKERLLSILQEYIPQAMQWAIQKNQQLDPNYRISAITSYARLAMNQQSTVLFSKDDFEEKWRSVEEVLKEHFMNGHTNGLQVKICILFHPTPTTKNQGQAKKAPPRTASGVLQSSTNQQLAAVELAQEEDPVVKITAELAERWKCQVSSCRYRSNAKPFCFIDPRNSNHIPMTSNSLKLWANKIHKDTSSRLNINIIPDGIKSAICAEHKRVTQEEKKAEKKALLGAPFGGSAQYGTPIAPFDIKNVSETQLEAELASRLQNKKIISDFYAKEYGRDYDTSRATSRLQSMAPPAWSEVERHSSPVEASDLREYIDWIKQVKPPHLSDAFDEAYEKLTDNGYTTDQIQQWKGFENRQKWEALGIKQGTGAHLADNVGIWFRSFKKQQNQRLKSPRNTALPTRPSPSRRGHIIRSIEDTEEVLDEQENSDLRALDEQEEEEYGIPQESIDLDDS